MNREEIGVFHIYSEDSLDEGPTVTEAEQRHSVGKGHRAFNLLLIVRNLQDAWFTPLVNLLCK